MMKKLTPVILLSFFTVIIAATIVGCGSSIELVSKWRTQNIFIDGKNTEWEGGAYLKESNAVINIYNDANYLYLGIISTDRQLSRKVMMNGFTVWLDRNASEDKDFGIHFPIGAINQEIPDMPQMTEETPENFDNPDHKRNMEDMFVKGMSEFEIMGKGGKVDTRLPILEKNGIEVKIGHSQDDKFIYELKMPLKIFGDIPYAIGTDTGKTICIGLETGEVDMEKINKKMGKKGHDSGDQEGGAMQGEPGTGGGMGGGRRGGGMPGGGMGRNFTENQKPLNIWIKTHLSSAK